MRRLIVEGWRFLPHSYAMVNQFQLLELSRRADWELLHRDVPFLHPHWRPARGVFDQESESILERIRAAAPEPADVIYRISFPMNLKPSASACTFVFGTSEQGCVPAHHILGSIRLSEAMRKVPVTLITPSNWSRDGFIRSGADPRRVIVVPHGFDPDIFRPAEEVPASERSDDFTFLHVGAMSGGKNMPVLLKAFGAVAEKHPRVRLHLKGLDSLYGSQQLLQRAVSCLTQRELERVQSRIKYSGGVVSNAEMARLYRSANAYVSPYSAEGFNLPVLEAAACGVPVICTAGGPTDDFVTEDFALRIESDVVESRSGLETVRSLRPRLDSLIAHMETVVRSRDWCNSAAAAGPRHVAKNFTWAAVVEQLVQVFDQQYAATTP